MYIPHYINYIPPYSHHIPIIFPLYSHYIHMIFQSYSPVFPFMVVFSYLQTCYVFGLGVFSRNVTKSEAPVAPIPPGQFLGI